jgi:hypothetical protein
MFKKILLQAVAICFVFSFTCIIQAEENEGKIKIGEGTTVGGHVKLKLVDFLKGKHDDGAVEDENNQYTGFGVAELHLIFSSDISDKVSIYFQPEWSSRTGATPSFGNNIGDQTAKETGADESMLFRGLVKGVIKWVAPLGFEIAGGVVKPRFTWDYGAELFWEDEYHGSKFTANDYLGAMHDTGIEIYRNFELGSISVPVYFYVLNGGEEYSDNNEATTNMIHIEPEFGPFKLLGSYSYGRYDDKENKIEQRWAAGVDLSLKGFTIRSEYAGINQEDAVVDENGKPEALEAMGYYVKVGYRYASWGRILLHYSYAMLNTGNTHFAQSGYDVTYTTLTGVLEFYLADSVILLFQGDYADWVKEDTAGTGKGTEDTLKFSRLTVGARATF